MKLLLALLFGAFLCSPAYAYKTSVYYSHYMSNGNKNEYRIRTFISNNFENANQQKIKDAFDIVTDEIEEHFHSEHVRNRNSSFRNCLNKYATKDIHPVQYRNVRRNKNQRISNLMSSMVMLFGLHKTISNRARFNHFFESITSGRIAMGKAPVYRTEWPDTRINISLNSAALDVTSTRDVAGTVFHEIMHNLGWRHPTGYPGSFIKEAGLCISRNNADKPSGFGLTGDPGYRIID